MLKSLRKKGVAKKIIWFVAIVIIISFGFLGTAYLITGNTIASHAGKIFGKKISFDQFQTIYRHVNIQARIRYGENYQSVQQYLNLTQETWDRLILLHEAQKRKIEIANDEVVKSIETLPFFQRDGQFDTLLYNDVLRFAFRIKPRDFEESIRDDLKIRKLFDQETASLTIDENEIFEIYKTQNEKIQISYVLFPVDKYKSEASFDEHRALEYYNENKLQFLIPTSVNVDYFFFPFPEDAENNALEEEKNQLREKTKIIYEDLLINQDMQRIAADNNLELKNSGLFSIEQPNLAPGWSYELLKQIFELKTGEINGPLESSKGIFIVKIRDKKETHVPDFAEARAKVVEAVLSENAKKIAKSKAEEFLKTLLETLSQTSLKDFPKTVKSLGGDIYQTPVFNRGQYLPVIGISKDFHDTAFSLKESGDISSVVETEKGACILHLDSYIPATKEDFEKKKEEIRTSLLNQKKNEVINEFLTKLRLEANLVDNISEEN